MERRVIGQSDRVRKLVLELWTKTRIDWGFASDKLAETFRRDRSLGARERREVAETLYGMIRQARRIDHALEVARAKAPPGPKRELARLLAYQVLEGELAAADAAQELAGVDFAAVLRVDEHVMKHERDPVRRLGLVRSLPDWLAGKLIAQLGVTEADALGAALNQRAPLTIRANRLKTTREALAAELAGAKPPLESHPTRWAADGLVLDTRVNVFALPGFEAGHFEVQDEASQLVAEAAMPAGAVRGTFVDLCAGAGGKSLALGALMASKGRLVATDVDERKLEELRRRARRAGLSNLRAVTVGEREWPDEIEALRGRAEVVLVDAPCSGVGAFRRNPEARWRLGADDVTRLTATQLEVAVRGAALVKPGGRLVYATCTILDEENEGVVRLLLEKEHGLQRVPLAELLGAARAADLAGPSGLALATWPHRHGTDGFFAAGFVKKA